MVSSLHACEPVLKTWWQNKAVKHGNDCSFTGGGRHDFHHGEAAVDLGNGRIAQVMYDFTDETALVTDCKSAEQISVYGTSNEFVTSCDSGIQYQMFTPPKGKLDVRAGKTLAELASLTKAAGYTVRTSRFFDSNKAQRKDYPDYFCGCKRHYPDSAGAKQ